MSVRHWAAAAVLVSVALPAAAVDFTFYKLGRGATDVLPTDGIVCTGGDRCSSNVDASVFGGDLTFVSGGITAIATASYTGGSATYTSWHTTAVEWSPGFETDVAQRRLAFVLWVQDHTRGRDPRRGPG